MLQVIQFLDAAGSDARQSAADYAASIDMLQIDTDQKRASLGHEHLALAALLKGRLKMYCHISLPYGDEPEPLQDDEDDMPGKEE